MSASTDPRTSASARFVARQRIARGFDVLAPPCLGEKTGKRGGVERVPVAEGYPVSGRLCLDSLGDHAPYLRHVDADEMLSACRRMVTPDPIDQA